MTWYAADKNTPSIDIEQGGYSKSLMVEVITANKTRYFATYYSYPTDDTSKSCWCDSNGGEIFSKIICWRYLSDFPSEFFK